MSSDIPTKAYIVVSERATSGELCLAMTRVYTRLGDAQSQVTRNTNNRWNKTRALGWKILTCDLDWKDL